MNDIFSVCSKVFEIMQVRLSFGSYSFSLFQVTCAFWAISIVGSFIYNVFDSD